MTRRRKLSTFLGRTPRGAVMGAVCVALIVLLAACGGGSTSNPSNPGASSSGLSGGNNISGKTILFEIKSGASNFFFVPAVNGAKAAAAFAGLNLQIQYG